MDYPIMKIRTINRRGHRGSRGGKGERFSATSAQTSASFAVKFFIFAALLCVLNASAQAQEPSPTPSPQQQTLSVPSVSTDYRANPNKSLPSLNRIGVDTAEHNLLASDEAIPM